MNNESDEDNLMRMTKEELQCWIQAEVERNPQLIQRHEQLAQVEEWVKQKEKDATCTRLLYSNACESVLECESVMKGLYVMLGLEYQEEDSEEEEGGGVKEPQDVIQIPDEDEEDGEEKSPCDDDNDIVVIDLGATNECLEPMLEKVTVAMEKSSRLVQDLVQMVTKTSSKNESFLDVSIRPSSTSISSESLTPVPCFSPRNQQPITESSIEIIKTESLSMAKTPETIGTHNTELTTTINTEPSDMFFLQNNCKDHRTAVSDACPSIASIKTEPQLKEVSPAFFSKSGNFMGTFKTEPDFMPVISGISSLSSDFKPDSENRGTLKTESQSKIQSYISNISSPETISSYTSESLATLKTEQLITKMKTEQPEIILSHSPDPISTNKNEPHSSVSSKTPLIPSDSEQSNTIQDHNSSTENLPSLCNSEQDKKISTDKSPSMNKAAADGRSSTRSPESSEKNKTRQKSSLKASSKTSRSQKVRQRSPSPDSSDESGEVSDSSVRSGDSYHPPLKSSKNMAKKSTSNVNRLSLKITNPVPASAAPPPAPSAPESPAAKPSDVKQISTDSSSSSLKVTKEIKLGVDAYVLAKVKSKTWYRGKVVETLTKGNGHRYKVEFKNGKKCLIPAHHLACLKPPLLKDLFIGCRVVASLKGEQEKICFKAAVMVELPDRKNRMRFLVFCDDGQAAYCALPDLHLVCKQFKHVWKDIDDETSRSQVKEYLGAFPNPIVVVLRIAQDTKAKRDGKFEPCTVLQLDGSLVQIKFKDDHKEWVYKGSNKLEHIVNIKKRLAEQKTQQPANTGSNTSATSSGVSQKSDTPATKNRPPSPQNTTISPVSSTSVTQQAGGTVAKAPTLSPENITSAASPQPASPQTDSLSSPSSQNTTPDASPSRVTPQTFSRVSKAPSLNLENATSAAFQPMVVLQKLDRHLSIPPVRSGSTPNLRTAKRPIDDEVEEDVSERNQAKSTNLCHRCCPTCLDGVRPKNVDIHHGHNPLQIPLLFKFRRMTARRRLEGKVFFHIFYRSPCGRSLCDMEEVQNYLFETRCDFLFLEMFCMDPFVLVNRARPPSASTSQPYLYLPDISQGREVLPVPCINEVDKTPAPSVRYTKDRILAPGVSINTSLDFMTGCDCTDGCQDRTKCSCHQLTIEGTSLCSDGPVDVTAGYLHKRLQTTLPTGVYECNPLCRCDPRICSNRLVQHGIQLRLELFMTQHKGWGIRCKDDVAKGTFICVFTGKVVTEDKMNEDDMVSGYEYLANLDFIEGVEKLKEGYESEAFCSDTENDNNKKTLTMKTGPLWKNTLFQDDSSSGEEKYEPMELDDKQKKINVCDKASRERKLSHRPQEKSEGQKVPGPKRCFAIKSFERRVKALERVDGQNEKTKKAQPTKNTRRLFDGEEMCYIIDARQEGNLGRFINHSCSPNLVVQNVFVDTHDLRFPWVAFFASKRIKAGTELTWDYNYEVGSVEGKVLLCCCGSSRCTGRLL